MGLATANTSAVIPIRGRLLPYSTWPMYTP